MPGTPAPISPVLPGVTPERVRAILGAMRAVAETGGAASDADRTTVSAAGVYMFGAAPTPWDALAPVVPAALAAALGGDAVGDDALKFAAVMALVDGKVDGAKIDAVAAYAAALKRDPRYLDELVEAAQGHLQAALADMTRANMLSLTGKPWAGEITAWLTPYGGAGADPALAARFEALGKLPEGSFGRAYWMHFHDNGYAFPGAPGALNAAFAIPHDSAHVLAGFDTKPRGELLTSTFSASMHRIWPMAGHVLPVIFTWHLHTALNPVTGAVEGALDPVVFWRAWAGGAATKVDLFALAPAWDFWGVAPAPMDALRRSYGIPPEGLDLPHGQAAAAGA